MPNQLTRGRSLAGTSLGRRLILTSAAALTLQPDDAGALVILSGTATRVVTLPPAARCKGMVFSLTTAAAPATGVGHTLDTAGTDVMRGNGFTAAAGKGAVNTQATAVAGDSITVASDGVSAWYITEVTGTWAREA